jgi:primosomal protein N' (replication factor Y) (superfamily II helicase)
VRQAASQIATQLENSCYEILGPAPAAIERLAGRYRWQILLKGGENEALPALEGIRSHCPAGVSLTIDVDPLHLL